MYEFVESMNRVFQIYLKSIDEALSIFPDWMIPLFIVLFCISIMLRMFHYILGDSYVTTKKYKNWDEVEQEEQEEQEEGLTIKSEYKMIDGVWKKQ